MDGKQGLFRDNPGLPALPRNGEASTWPPGRPEDRVSTLQTLAEEMRLYNNAVRVLFQTLLM